jgi:hypothetical protein
MNKKNITHTVQYAPHVGQKDAALRWRVNKIPTGTTAKGTLKI